MPTTPFHLTGDDIMPKASSRYPNVVQQEVARLLVRGSEGTLEAVSLAREDDLDMVVSIPHEGPGVIGLRIETSSRLTKGPFGEWLVIDAAAPTFHFQHDPRALFVFGHFVPADDAFTGPIFMVPAAFVESRPGVKGKSARLTFRARLDAVNQEWSDFAFTPDQIGARLLDLLREMPNYQQQAA
jgi:hypothetical protein